MSTKTEDKADTKTKADKNVIAGPAIAEKTVVDQAKEARGEDKPKKVAEVADTSAADANYTDEQKSKDAAVKAKVAHLKVLGIDPEVPDTGMHKVEEGTGGKLYSGVVTVTSVSGEYDNSKISTRIDIGSQPRGEGWLKYAFKVHFPSANTDAVFTVDETNKDDPLLRTKFD